MGMVYKATNKINGKSYIGKTRQSLEKRKYQHNFYHDKNVYVSLFHRAIEKYGWESFMWDVVYEGEDYSKKEYDFIDQYGDYNIIRVEKKYNNPPRKKKKKIVTNFSKKSITGERKVRILKERKPPQSICVKGHPRYDECADGMAIKKKYKIGKPFYMRILNDNNLDPKLNLRRYFDKRKKDWELQRMEKEMLYSRGIKRKNKQIKEDRSINVGKSHPSWSGYWITPMGKYETLASAAKDVDISPNVLSKICKQSDNYTTNRQCNSIKWFKDNNISPDSKISDIGFGFLPASATQQPSQ
jgi:group I intron endonuclease